MTEQPCEHQYVHLRTIQRKSDTGHNTYFKQITVFFCQKCLKQIEAVKDGHFRERPDWWE